MTTVTISVFHQDSEGFFGILGEGLFVSCESGDFRYGMGLNQRLGFHDTQ